MGIDLGNNGQTNLPEKTDEKDVVQSYDIVQDRTSLTKQFENSPEVDALASQLEVYNLESIVTFGGDTVNEISKASDYVLNSMDMSKINDSGTLLTTLSRIMEKFDIKEIQEDPQGLFGKLFTNLKKQLEKILDKYHTMGEEVDKIYVQLKQYEGEIKQSNRNLDQMFKANVNHYHQLVKYILAGEQGSRELQAYIEQKRQEFAESGDNAMQFEIQTLEQAGIALEQRIMDLRIAENIAMQSIPMIKTMEFSNMNLVRKINSAFIITLPIFKQALAQAIMLKRQKVQAEALSELDKKTNEMLLQNARNSVEQSKLTQQLVSGSSVKIETLEETWRTIMNGIEETRLLQESNQKQREEDKKRLEAIKEDFKSKYSMPQR